MVDFGLDLSCTNDLDLAGRLVTGRRLVAEAIYRRLSTRRGGLIDDQNYGFDLSALINDEITERDIAQVLAAIGNECRKDERVISASATGSMLGGVLTIKILLDIGDGPFPLVLAASAVTVEIMRAPS